jgi:hypothetical protein
MLLTNLTEQKFGLKGVESLLLLVPTLPVLISVLDTFRAIEKEFPHLGWETSEYLSSSNMLRAGLAKLITLRMEEALEVQVAEAVRAYDDVTSTSGWGAVSELMPLPDSEQKKAASGSICFRSAVHILDLSYVAHPLRIKYAVVQDLPYQYIAERLPGTKPTGIVYTTIELRDASGWPAPTTIAPADRQQGGVVVSNQTFESVAHCSQMLLLKTPVVWGATPGIQEPDRTALSKTLLPLLEKLPRYNNAVINQAQILQMQQLTDILIGALFKFDGAVRAEPSQNGVRP